MSIISGFIEGAKNIYGSTLVPQAKSAQREVCVALAGYARTPLVTVIENGTVMTLGTVACVYGLYKACTAKTWKETGKYVLVSAAGFFVAGHEASRNFTDFTKLAHAGCSGYGGNRFPGWEECAKAARGTFSYLENQVTFQGPFTCPFNP